MFDALSSTEFMIALSVARSSRRFWYSTEVQLTGLEILSQQDPCTAYSRFRRLQEEQFINTFTKKHHTWWGSLWDASETTVCCCDRSVCTYYYYIIEAARKTLRSNNLGCPALAVEKCQSLLARRTLGNSMQHFLGFHEWCPQAYPC